MQSSVSVPLVKHYSNEFRILFSTRNVKPLLTDTAIWEPLYHDLFSFRFSKKPRTSCNGEKKSCNLCKLFVWIANFKQFTSSFTYNLLVPSDPSTIGRLQWKLESQKLHEGDLLYFSAVPLTSAFCREYQTLP